MKLSEACEINPRSQAISDDTLISFVAMPDVSEDGKINTSVVRPYGEVKKGYTIFQEGDVLFAKITPCMENGKGAQALGLQNGIGVGSTEFHILRPNPDILDGMWLYYLTAWPAFRHEAEIHMTGSAGQKRVPKAFLERYQVDIPALNEQKVQVSQLDRVRKIIESRQRQLRTLDTLIKARFVEMFGHSAKRRRLEDYTELITKGASPKWQGIDYTDEGTLFVTSENVREGYVDLSKRKYLPDTINQIQPRSVLHRNDVLINIVGASIGRAAIFNSNELANINQAVALVRLREEAINLQFLITFLNSQEAQRSYGLMKKGGARDNLSLKNISDLMIPIAAISEQEQFATFVSQVDKSKVVVQAALDKAQVLFDGLMQEYFG